MTDEELTPPEYMDDGPGVASLDVFERGDEVELGQDLAAVLGTTGQIVATENRVWRYEDCAWTPIGDGMLKKMAQGYAGRLARGGKGPRQIKLGSRAVTGVVECCKVHLGDEQFFASAAVGVPFKSHFVRIVNGKIVVEELTPEHRIRSASKPDYEYDPDAARPEVVERLLFDTWAGKDDIEERIRYFWEWLGAALAGISTNYKDSPLLVGVKDTGKSALLDVIEAPFPVNSRRVVSLHDMAKDDKLAHLVGGRVNIVNELPSRELMESERAKAVLSGQSVLCRPLYSNPFEWLPRCAHAANCNELPPSKDPALTERFVVLDCCNVVPREKQDRELRAKIQKEAGQIAMLAIRYLQDLLDRGHFIRPETSDGLQSEWKLQSDSVAGFVEDRVRPLPGAQLPGEELYAKYQDWCKANGNQPLANCRFAPRLLAMGFKRMRSNGSRWELQIVGPSFGSSYRGMDVHA